MLDLRLPIGIMFSTVGALLAIFGLWTSYTDPKLYQVSLGLNVNLWWGLFLVVFGAVMWIFGRRGSRGGS